ncbi:hypothetical protein [Nocardiopsis synnemataformans]|uniref:hypothetical protein n=1 Tax=Nocardiopsis synnemataformans TaxID=61305 RepID=UPI003EBF655A
MVHSDQPFVVLGKSVALLTADPAQPTLSTAELNEVDAPALTASEVITVLRHGPGTAADALWHRVFALSRAGEATWTVIAAGAMLPRMVIACRFGRVPAQQIADVEAEMLVALLEQVRSIPAGVGDVGARLWSAVANTAYRCGYRHARDARRSTRWDPDTFTPDRVMDGRGAVTVLAAMVAGGVLTPVEADLVARTRLERTTLATVAEELGLTYITARRWRRAAEEKVAVSLSAKKIAGADERDRALNSS